MELKPTIVRQPAVSSAKLRLRSCRIIENFLDELQESSLTRSFFLCQQMKVVAMCMMAVLLVGSATGGLPPPERSYKILMILAAASKSHRNVFMPLVDALADRGHKVGHSMVE